MTDLYTSIHGSLSFPSPNAGERGTAAAEGVAECLKEVDDRLGADDDVERCRQGGTLVKIAHPQLGPRKLPLHVRVILNKKRRGSEQQKAWLRMTERVVLNNKGRGPEQHMAWI